MTRASILIPSFERADSLRIAVASVLAQTVHDVEAVIVGDGVTDAVRAAATELAADDRVVFHDNPKGPHHGEIYRHDAILAARGDAIFYLCDDDVLLPTHVEELLALLETHNFVHSLNGYIAPDGSIGFYAADLADPETIAWHLRDDVRYNRVSITGTAHSRQFYLDLDDPWSTTPPDEWPDHHQWRKFMARPEFSGATSTRMTALQLPTSGDGRDSWTETERLAELRRWAAVSQVEIDELVAAAARRTLAKNSEQIAWMALERARIEAETTRDLDWLSGERTRLDDELRMARDESAYLRAELETARSANQGEVDAQRSQVNTLRTDFTAAVSRVAILQDEINRMRGTRSWRLTSPLRGLYARLRR